MYVYGRSSVSRLRSDAKAVDGLGVGLGKAGGGAMPRVLPVLVEEQDRAKQAGKCAFHNTHQLLQYFLQRSIAGYHLQNTALSITQRLCPLVLGDVDHGTDEFNEIAGWTENGMAYCVDVPDLAAGMNDSVIELEPRLFTAFSFQLFHGPDLIIRVNALKECFDSRQLSVRVKTQHAVAFLGPVPAVSRSGSPCPTACVAERLRFRQITLAPAQRLLRLLCCGHVYRGSDEFHEVARLVQDRTANRVEVLDRSVRKNNAVVHLKLGFLDFGSLKKVLNALPIFRMERTQ